MTDECFCLHVSSEFVVVAVKARLRRRRSERTVLVACTFSTPCPSWSVPTPVFCCLLIWVPIICCVCVACASCLHVSTMHTFLSLGSSSFQFFAAAVVVVSGTQKLVEVIRIAETSDETFDSLKGALCFRTAFVLLWLLYIQSWRGPPQSCLLSYPTWCYWLPVPHACVCVCVCVCTYACAFTQRLALLSARLSFPARLVMLCTGAMPICVRVCVCIENCQTVAKQLVPCPEPLLSTGHPRVHCEPAACAVSA